MTKMITCVGCGEVKKHYAKGLCVNCYKTKNSCDRKHRLGLSRPFDENKDCSSYLGVIAEQVLSKVYKDVQVMPYGNPGFDFICNKGYKIDVKSGCTRINNKSNNWIFIIKKNKIPDYFLCLAFDNRNDINPLYYWLIPNHIVNDKVSIGISKSTINKWDEYKLDINKVIECCNNMRGD